MYGADSFKALILLQLNKKNNIEFISVNPVKRMWSGEVIDSQNAGWYWGEGPKDKTLATWVWGSELGPSV